MIYIIIIIIQLSHWFGLGAVQLVDVSSKLPGLRYRQGLTHWLPTSRDMRGYTSYNDVPEKWHTQVRPQMFPPAPEDVHKFNLERW
jgi:tRNA (cytosine34-C5)-methyltransferase